MPRYKLTIAYDGTDFCGWQKQEPPVGLNIDAAMVLAGDAEDVEGGRLTLRTVQEIVERAVRKVVREPVQLVGASRTDAGVHARGQVAAFTCSGGEEEAARDTDAGEVENPQPRPRSGWPVGRGGLALLRALNSRLPDDVQIVGVEEASADFNPIGDATSKAYSYSLHVSPHRPLWERRYVHHIWVPLDVARMQEAAARFVGEHDFAAFAAAGHGRISTVRTIYTCSITQRPLEGAANPDWATQLRIDISGNGFLWNMIRIIAGTLVEVGRGKLAPEDISRIIEGKDRRSAGPTLPPTGLRLEWIRYGGIP